MLVQLHKFVYLAQEQLDTIFYGVQVFKTGAGTDPSEISPQGANVDLG